jgi:membrane AbrB-like protein
MQAVMDARTKTTRWLVLLFLSVMAVYVLTLLHVPAALLIGPMFAAILLAVNDRMTKVPGEMMYLAQGVIGCLMANAIPVTLLSEIAKAWPIFLLGVFSVLLVSVLFGWLLARFQVLPGSTAIWGSVPGAASAMTIMSESYGADVRLVALMQYTRVLMVALAAALVSRFFVTQTGAAAPASVIWFPPINWIAFLQTILLIVVSMAITKVIRIPAGMLLLPLLIGAFLHDLGYMRIQLPPWLLAISYAVVGWNIGQRYTRDILVYAAKVLPRVLLSIVVLILICGLFAFVLMQLTDVDPLTAYLAMSPGGADSVAIIAVSAKVDISFVMAMQLARFLVMLLVGPALARIVVKLARFPVVDIHKIAKGPVEERVKALTD